MDPYLAGLSALWLGVLTSVSPCPLATNIATVSYLSHRLDDTYWVFVRGAAYTAGRITTYVVLGALLVAGLMRAPVVSYLLGRYLNQFLGPLLILVGMVLLDLLPVPILRGSLAARFRERLAGRGGVLGAFALGVLFALSFCPVSAALFFGSLVPLAVAHNSPILLPSLFGTGTGLPVLAFAVLATISARSIARMFERVSTFELWARRFTGLIFIGAGIYLTLVYVYRVTA